jgi:hypothetical protein
MKGTYSADEIRARQNEELQELYRQLDEKDRVLENYKKSRGGLEVFFNRVLSAVTPISPPPLAYEPPARARKSKVFAVNHTSDSHMGAVVEPSEIEGMGEFNPEICTRRNMGFAQSTLKYYNTMRNAYTINELHWLFTGDLISGDIHDELRITNAFPSPVQVVEAAKTHAGQVACLSPYFEKIVVHFLVADNHARLTNKPQAAEAGVNSLNYLVGILMEQYLSKCPNIDFRLYPQEEKVVNIGGMQYLLLHGHSIQGWMGVPWYGIERKAGKEATARLAAIMREQQDTILKKMKEIGFHKMCHGHFHVKFNSELYCCAASVQGTTAYDHRNARFSEPSQPAWLIGDHGEFARTDFKLSIYD